MLLPRQTRGFAAICAFFAGALLPNMPAFSEVRVWSPGQHVPTGVTSGIQVWSPETLASQEETGLPDGVDDQAPDAAEAAPPPPPPEKPVADQAWSVTTVTPSYRHYRLRRALGQRYTGFKRQYRGQRYTGFKRFPRIRRYKVQKSTVKVSPAERHILVINRVPGPRGHRPGPVAVVPAYTDLPDGE